MLAAIGATILVAGKSQEFSVEVHKTIALETYEHLFMPQKREVAFGNFTIQNAKKTILFILRLKAADEKPLYEMVRIWTKKYALLTIAPTGTTSI